MNAPRGPGTRPDAASGALVGLLVAGLIVALTLTAAVTLMGLETGGTTSQAEAAALKRVAQDGVRLLVEDAGATASGEAAWDTDPEALERFGLASSQGRNFLSGEKIRELRQGAMAADGTNGHPDYPEVKEAFGMDGDFHLRIYPLVYGVDDPRWRPYKGLELAFIGNAESASIAPETDVDVVQAASPAGAVAVTFTLTCTSGPAEDVYLVTTRLDTGNGRDAGTIARSVHSPRVACDGTPVDFDVRWENLEWAQGAGSYTLSYDVKSLVRDEAVATEETRTITLQDGTEAFTLTAESLDWNFAADESESPRILLDKRERDGSRYKTAVPVTAHLYAPGSPLDWTAPDHVWTGTIEANKETEAEFPAATASAGTWTVIVRSDDGEAEVQERFTFTATGMTTDSFALSSDAQKELTFLTELTEDIDPTHYDEDTNQDGDVFFDRKSDTMKTLGYAPHGDGVLANYEIVVVGTNVDTQSLTGAFAEDLREWVDAGGTLIVLGNEKQGAQWMEAGNAFAISFESASGALLSPDPTHPMLHAPDELRYNDYDASRGRTYRMTGGELEGYDHVLVASQSDTESEDVLAVSNAGVYDEGTVVVTSLLPAALTNPQDDAEAKKLLNNLLSRALDTLHLDYGPAIPSGAAVESATRTAVVPHPDAPEILMEVKVVLYVWN